MKNKIYIFGIICILLVLLGAIFKIQHWPFAGILLTLGLTSFTLGFMPIALISSYRAETDKKLKRLYIVAYVCIFIECMLTLFTLQHWPGTNILRIIGTPLPFVLFLPVYLMQIRKNKQLNYNNLLLVLFFFAYFAAVTALLSLNVSRDILHEYVDSANSYEEQAKLTNLQTSAIVDGISAKDAKDSIKKVSMLKIKAKSASLYELIDKIKVGIIKNVDEQAIDAEGNITLSKIIGLDNKNISMREEFKAKSTELRKGLSEFRDLLVTSLNTKEVEVAEYVNHLLNTPDSWQFSKFDGKYMIAIIDALCSIKNNVALAELETVSAINASSL